METLKSGDVPALITNIEVMQILSARAYARRKEAEAEGEDVAASKKRRKRPDDRRHRHRDWIESRLLEYLKNSSCGHEKVDSSKMRELVGKLRGVGTAGFDATHSESAADTEIANADQISPNDNRGQEREESARGGGGAGFGLTDGETLQILNHMPSELVELHLMIEDLPSRMNDERQEELLALVGEYTGRSKDEQQEQEVEGIQQETEGMQQDFEDYCGEQASYEKKSNGGRVVMSENAGGQDGSGSGDEEILGTISGEE